MGAIAERVGAALFAAAPRVLAGATLIDERALDDTSGRLRTGVGHIPVLQPPGGRVASATKQWCRHARGFGEVAADTEEVRQVAHAKHEPDEGR